MRKNFKFLSLGLVFVLMLAMLAACGVEEPEQAGDFDDESEEIAGIAEPEVTLVYAEVNPLDSIVGQMASAYKEKVEELSNGKIKIDIQASGVLGSENDVLDTMLGGGGTIDMSRISAFALTSYGGEKSMLLSIPFTFVDRDHFGNLQILS